jgi:hypothetical protein
MPDFLRPVVARIAGALVAALVTWLASKYGVVIPEEAKGQLTEGTVAAMMTLFTVVYALVHKAVSVKTNPADAASPSLAEEGKDLQKVVNARKNDTDPPK